jgi:4'-phosphopantetheinyl transferase
VRQIKFPALGVTVWLAHSGDAFALASKPTEPLTEALLDQRTQDTCAMLSASASARCAAFKSPKRQQQFLASRLLLAHAASDTLVQQGADYTVAQLVPKINESACGPCFAPAEHWGATPPWLSLSHSGEWIAAVAFSRRVGIDIERIATRDIQSIARRVLPPEELSWVFGANTGQNERFYRLWTLREAAYKCGLITLVSAGPVWVQPDANASADNFPVDLFAQTNNFPVDLFAKANNFPVDLFAKANNFPVDLFAKANKCEFHPPWLSQSVVLPPDIANICSTYAGIENSERFCISVVSPE